MEHCDVTIEQITADVLESILQNICEDLRDKSRDAYLTFGIDSATKFQPDLLTCKEDKSRNAVICDDAANELEKSDFNQLPKYDEAHDLSRCCCDDASTSDVIETDYLTMSHNNAEAYTACDLIIKELLETLDTNIPDNDTIIPSQSMNSLTKPVSDLHGVDQTGHKILDEIAFNDFYDTKECGITNHCDITKEVNDQKLSSKCCDVTNSEIKTLFTEIPETDDDFDSEIENMVDQILSNNADDISDEFCSSTNKPKKSKSHPIVKIVNLVQNGTKPDTPTTPECSDNFAELTLHATPSSGEGQAENDIPNGWLNTLTNRKHRTNQKVSRKDSREVDFVYCGPVREINNNEEGADASPCMTCLKLSTPQFANDIPSDLLYSGVAVTPGSRDRDGSSLVFLLADDIVWQKCNIGAISLARYLLYLTSRSTRITFMIDERNSRLILFKNFLEALTIFQNNSHTKVSRILLLLSDKENSVQVILNALFDCECIGLHCVEDLTKYIDISNLLSKFGGCLDFSQAEWAHNRLVVDSFISFCENVRHNFARETLAMTSQSLPDNVKDTRSILAQHHKDMTQLLDDRQVANLRERGQRILQQLSDNKCADALSCAELVQSAYSAANDAVTHFVQVADDKLLTLEQHLLVKQFEQSCDYIYNWSTTNMKILTEQFGEMADSFDTLRSQRHEFDDFYMKAMTEYAKCDCLLSEVEELNKLGYLREVELTQRAKITEEQVKNLVDKMERKKEEVEAASQMYKFIDQAYSWALDGMKFVAMLNMEECLTLEACHQMLERFDRYMEEHPSILQNDFNEMLELAHRYGNLKCLRQCEFAQQKCRETSELFNKRRDLIAKVKTQIKSSSKKRITSFRMKNREKLDKNAQTMNPDPERSRSPGEGESSDCREQRINSTDSSIETMSTYSAESSSAFDEISQHSIKSSSSSNYTGVSENNCSSKSHNPKPARKMLKKSSSVPNHQLTRNAINHVHSQSGTTLTIGSPVQIEEADTRGKSKISLIIEELISTEQEYVKSLNYVIENYFPEMCRLDIPQALRCKRNVIFGNIEKIAEFHSGYFLRDLEKCEGNPLQVAKTFLLHRESFGLYALYSKNKPQSDQLLQEHGNEFFKTKQFELGDKMDLASYLLKPVQRMGKYALLLHAMAKRATMTEERGLKDAEELVKFQLRHGNDLLTMDSIRDCDVNLKEQGNLIRQEQFMIYCGRRKIVRRVFLFEDLILFSKPIHVHGGHDVYQYKCSYKTAEIGMTENIGDSGFKFEIWFRRRRAQTTQDRFVLQGSSRAVKRSWVEEIRGLLWKQALRNRDHRKIEMSSMGVGSKPHLDLAGSSVNRITDRSVVTTPPGDRSLADRLMHSRTRASIAVSSFDHVTQHSKRPHSTISTSSSTSSVGSGTNQSGSIISSLTLASWPTKLDSRQGLSPPMAYCDFHAIAEDLNEDCESTSESSVCSSQGESADVSEKTPVARQYVTTPNLQLLVK